MKKIKIIIPVLLVILVILGVVAYVILSNEIAFTGKGKVQNGLAKSFNFFEENEKALTDFEEYKYMKNIDSKPFEAEVKFNVDADFEGLEEFDKDFSKMVEKVTEEIADSDITFELAMDKKNKQMVCGLNLDAEDICGNLTGEAFITDEELAFRSEDINEKFLKITKEDAVENDMYEIVGIFNFADELFSRNFNDLIFSKEEIEHFKDTYGVVLKNTITNKMINSEKGEFVVNGEKIKCTVTTVKFDNDKFQELLNNYINAYKDDKEGKEILKKKFSLIYGEKKAEKYLKNIDDKIEEFEERIEDIEDTSLEFITYGTATEVYGNEYKLTIYEETLDLVETFNSDNTTYTVSFGDEELLNVIVKNAKGELNVDAKIVSGREEMNFNFTKTNEKVALSIKTDEFEYLAKADIKVKTNTDTEFARDVNFIFEKDVSGENLKETINVKMNETLKIVDSIDVPNTDKAISVFNQNKFEKYADDSMDGIQKISDKFKKSDLYKAIKEYSISYGNQNILKKGQVSAKETQKVMAKEDLMSAVLCCQTDYLAEKAFDTSLKEDYLTKEKLNFYITRGKVTKYDSTTGKGTYEPLSEEIEPFDFTIDNWRVTIENESDYYDDDYEYDYSEDDYNTESNNIGMKAQSAAQRTKMSACEEDLMLSAYSCKADYECDKSEDKNVKKEDYLTKERLNYYITKGKITKYDSTTGKGTYEPESKEIESFDFTIDDWNVTVEE